MASISNTAANLYNYTAPVTDPSLLNGKKANSNISPTTVAQAKLTAESTIVSIGNNQKSDSLTYNALGLLGNANQNTLTQDTALQVQSVISDTLNSLRVDVAANIPSDILAQIDIPGVTSSRV